MKLDESMRPAIIALALGIPICFALACCCMGVFARGIGGNSNYAAAIERVLEEDARTNDGAASVAEVVQRMERIDVSDCPIDFQQAYVRHISAWQAMMLVEQEALRWLERYNSGSAMVEAFLRGFVFDFNMTAEAEQQRARILEMNQRAADDVRTTFEDVKVVAIGYGVDVSPNSSP